MSLWQYLNRLVSATQSLWRQHVNGWELMDWTTVETYFQNDVMRVRSRKSTLKEPVQHFGLLSCSLEDGCFSDMPLQRWWTIIAKCPT